jgi:hypothetical protein
MISVHVPEKYGIALQARKRKHCTQTNKEKAVTSIDRSYITAQPRQRPISSVERIVAQDSFNP